MNAVTRLNCIPNTELYQSPSKYLQPKQTTHPLCCRSTATPRHPAALSPRLAARDRAGRDGKPVAAAVARSPGETKLNIKNKIYAARSVPPPWLAVLRRAAGRRGGPRSGLELTPADKTYFLSETRSATPSQSLQRKIHSARQGEAGGRKLGMNMK